MEVQDQEHGSLRLQGSPGIAIMTVVQTGGRLGPSLVSLTCISDVRSE